MKQIPFERQKDHYDGRFLAIDEQICALIKQRIELSKNNPSTPPDEQIAEWAKKFDLYEDLLNAVFGTVRMADDFKPRIEPSGFRKHVPVLKSIEIDDAMYTVTFIRQFENASVVNLSIDWNAEEEEFPEERFHRNFYELFIGEQYHCRNNGGGGSHGNMTHTFIVSPPLPDDISGLDLVFIQYPTPFRDKANGKEIIFHID